VWIKFGQMLSTRRDLFPPHIADQLALLQPQTGAKRLILMAVWHPEEHPPPDTQRQRDPHFGDAGRTGKTAGNAGGQMTPGELRRLYFIIHTFLS
jgi:phage baseplate assembly protein gpV